jgi:nucleoside-diphosphate-sugar epimerase
VRDYGLLRSLAVGVDRILHLAAVARFADADADPARAHSINVLGTLNVARVSDELHIPVVYASTGSVYMPIKREPPITEDFPAVGNSLYGCTKYLGELYIRESSAPWIILRYAHLYGAEKRHHGLIGGVLERLARGLEPVLYGGQQSNDFTYVDDVALANRLALEATSDNWNEVYNVGTGEELSAAEAAAVVCAAAGYKGDTQVVPGRSVDPARFVYDTTKAEARLGFKAQYSFAKGIEAMMEEVAPPLPR